MNTETTTRGTMVVTLSVAERVYMLESARIRMPRMDFRPFYIEYVDLLRRCVLPHDVTVLDSFELSMSVCLCAAATIERDPLKILIGLCRNIDTLGVTHSLSINRIFDIEGRFVGYGPRPGNPTLDAQLSEIKALHGQKQIVLVDDGSYTGKTLVWLLHEFKKHDLVVSDIVIGVGTAKAVEALSSVYSGSLNIVHRVDNIVDWLAAHDTIPFLAHSGRSVGAGNGVTALPFVIEGMSLAYPYISPFGDLSLWMSIPRAMVREFSLCGINAAEKIFRVIGQYNQRAITVRDIVCGSRVSMPYRMGYLEDPVKWFDRSILEYLEFMKGEIPD